MSTNVNSQKQSLIRLDNVVFGYDNNTTTLDGVTLDILKNEYVCIIGHNGSGKSTISKILTGLIKPRSGSIFYDNQEITKSNAKLLTDHVGIIFQNPDNQFIGLSVEDDIAFGLENKKIEPHKMWDIIQQATKTIGINNLLKYDSSTLSGGQKQKVAIASILAINPDVFIFDESISMLDPLGKEEIKNLMLDLKNKMNKTIISITHDMEEVINADRVIVMNKGKVLATGSPNEIFKDQKKLQEISLDFPFTLKLSSLLNSQLKNINVTLDVNSLLENIANENK